MTTLNDTFIQGFTCKNHDALMVACRYFKANGATILGINFEADNGIHEDRFRLMIESPTKQEITNQTYLDLYTYDCHSNYCYWEMIVEFDGDF